MQVLCLLLNRDQVDLDIVPQFFCSLPVGLQFYSLPKHPCRALSTEKRELSHGGAGWNYANERPYLC